MITPLERTLKDSQNEEITKHFQVFLIAIMIEEIGLSSVTLISAKELSQKWVAIQNEIEKERSEAQATAEDETVREAQSKIADLTMALNWLQMMIKATEEIKSLSLHSIENHKEKINTNSILNYFALERRLDPDQYSAILAGFLQAKKTMVEGLMKAMDETSSPLQKVCTELKREAEKAWADGRDHQEKNSSQE